MINKEVGLKYSWMVIYILSLFCIAYLVRRTDFILLLSFGALGSLSLWMLSKKININGAIKQIIFAAVLLYGALLFYTPQLSDDVYRFIWDGIQTGNGINPFLQTPVQYATKHNLSVIQTEIFPLLNSPNYYTVYPPIAQYIYSICGIVNAQNLTINIVLIRIIYATFYIGFVIALYHYAKMKKLDFRYVVVLIFNPIVLIEGFVNLHIEWVMLFFVICSLYFIENKKYLLSSVLFGLAISSKLHIAIALPFVVLLAKSKNTFTYLTIATATVCILFTPFMNFTTISNIWLSITLFIDTFEFNASIFYIVKSIGYNLVGYDTIRTAGPLLNVLSGFGILVLYIRSYQNKIEPLRAATYAFTIFYLLASIVHPWYIIVPFFFGLLSNVKYPFIWLLLGWVSYHAYTPLGFNENYVWVLTEYLLLFGVIIYEFRSRNLRKINL
jgi:alpha-1,6-mannosyltransferase